MWRHHVFVVTPGSFLIPSGKSSSVETVVHEVTTLANERYKVKYTIFGRKGKKQAIISNTKPGFSYIRTFYKKPRSYIYRASRWIRKLQPECIQVENRPRFVITLRHHFPNKRIILSLHSTTFISPSRISRHTLAKSLNAADVVQVNSEFLADYLRRYTPIDPAKIRVNYLGVNTDRFPSRWEEEQVIQRERFLTKHGLHGRKIVVFVGRMIRIKGVHHLIQAMPAIIKRVPEVMLLIVGGAFYGSNIKTAYVKELYAQSRAFRSHVQFVPYVSHSNIYPWYRVADVCVVPSFQKEAFGLVNVEAMAAGVPVIATNSGGMKEVIDHGITGLLIDSDNIVVGLEQAIMELLTDPMKMEWMGRRGADRMRERFTWSHTAERLLQMYEE